MGMGKLIVNAILAVSGMKEEAKEGKSLEDDVPPGGGAAIRIYTLYMYIL